MVDKHKSLSYTARVKLKKDVRKNRENTLEVMDWAKTVYPQIIGGPNLSYDLVDEQEPEKWLFFYLPVEKELREFGNEIVAHGFATEVTYGSVKPSFMDEINPRTTGLAKRFYKKSL